MRELAKYWKELMQAAPARKAAEKLRKRKTGRS